MSPQGTAAYDRLTDLPPLVERAVAVAQLAPDLAGLVATRRFGYGRLPSLAQLPSRRFFGAPGRNVIWSNVAAHPSPVGDWARKPTRTNSAGSPESAK